MRRGRRLAWHKFAITKVRGRKKVERAQNHQGLHLAVNSFTPSGYPSCVYSSRLSPWDIFSVLAMRPMRSAIVCAVSSKLKTDFSVSSCTNSWLQRMYHTAVHLVSTRKGWGAPIRLAGCKGGSSLGWCICPRGWSSTPSSPRCTGGQGWGGKVVSVGGGG